MGALHHLCTRVLSLGLLLLVFAVCGVLAGCGGGDPEDEPDVPTPRVDCQANPKACA